ncbi:hypothetical protein LCGC14_0267600 [marine sediment metagenome]|uniref:Uncharacterized protein n=1 Tax=marine sediment metagenome TaxID=412755 RepID=A0A0F9U4P7_9ZZZZ
MINLKGELQIDLNTGKIWFNSDEGICIVRIQGIKPEQFLQPTTPQNTMILDLNLTPKPDRRDICERCLETYHEHIMNQSETCGVFMK